MHLHRDRRDPRRPPAHVRVLAPDRPQPRGLRPGGHDLHPGLCPGDLDPAVDRHLPVLDVPGRAPGELRARLPVGQLRPAARDVEGRRLHHAWPSPPTPTCRPTFGYAQGFDEFRVWKTESAVRLTFLGRVAEDLLGPTRLARVLGEHGDIVPTADIITDITLERVAQHPQGPFFLYVHYIDPHFPYRPPAPWDASFDHRKDPPRRAGNVDPVALAAPERREWLARTLDQYDGEILYADHHVGRLLKGLEAQGLLKNSLVIVTADHGEEFYDHGGIGHGRTAYEEVLRVPLLMRWPGRIPAGATCTRSGRADRHDADHPGPGRRGSAAETARGERGRRGDQDGTGPRPRGNSSRRSSATPSASTRCTTSATSSSATCGGPVRGRMKSTTWSATRWSGRPSAHRDRGKPGSPEGAGYLHPGGGAGRQPGPSRTGQEPRQGHGARPPVPRLHQVAPGHRSRLRPGHGHRRDSSSGSRACPAPARAPWPACSKAQLRRRGWPVEVLDGDEVRLRLTRGLGFSREDRDENIRRISFVARLLARHGVVAITAAISPFRAAREEARREIERFVEVYVRCGLSTCVERDVKGLYRRALAGEIPNFTGHLRSLRGAARTPRSRCRPTARPPRRAWPAIVARLEALGYVAPVPLARQPHVRPSGGVR